MFMKLLINENEPITNEHNLKYKIVDNKVIITGVDSDVTDIEIPDEIEGEENIIDFENIYFIIHYRFKACY